MTLGPGRFMETLRDEPPAPALQKPAPRVVVKAEKKAAKKANEKTFRKAVWTRDKSRSRASKKPLGRSGTDFDKVGEVHHVIARSLAPERVYDVANGILLSKTEHALAETVCSNAPDKFLLGIDGPDDRGLPQTFIWRDVHGNEKRRRVG